MILFSGDSFTWGQGLEWDVLLKSDNWDVDKINNKLIPPKHANENLPLYLNEYREKNRWAHKVAEHFDYGYDLLRCGNGGSNYDNYFQIKNLNHIVIPENVNEALGLPGIRGCYDWVHLSDGRFLDLGRQGCLWHVQPGRSWF